MALRIELEDALFKTVLETNLNIQKIWYLEIIYYIYF